MVNIVVNKKWLILLITFVVLSINIEEQIIGSINVTADAQVQLSTSFSSGGLIFYPNSPSDGSSSDPWTDEVPIPINAPTPNPESMFAFTGLGADYLLIYGVTNPNANSANAWTNTFTNSGVTKPWYAWSTYFNGYSVTRLGFTFNPHMVIDHSIMGYAAFDRVLELFSSVDGKVIIANFDYGDTYWDSTAWWNKWLDMTSYYKGDSRIAAFEIFNEMYPEIHNGHSSAWIVSHWAKLTRAIHAIDPDRVVMFPTGQLDYDFASQWLPDLLATGIQNEPNVVFDILHPYYFENPSWDYHSGYPQTPEGTAQWYADAWIAPCVNALGASRCYSGESFAWVDSEYTPSLQQRWLVAIINQSANYGISFNLWAGLGVPSEMNAQISAIHASSYP